MLQHVYILNYFGPRLIFTTDPESGMCYIIYDPELEICYITYVNSPNYLGIRLIQYSWPWNGDVLYHVNILNYFLARLSFTTDPESGMCYITYEKSPNYLGIRLI